MAPRTGIVQRLGRWWKRNVEEFSSAMAAPGTYHRPSRERLLLAQFKTPQEVAKWQVASDKAFGGLTEGQFIASDSRTGIFEGNMSLEISGKMARSGFCATMINKGAVPQDWQETDTISILLRADDRRYMMNILTSGMLEDALYQAPMTIDTPHEWTTCLVPMRSFLHTREGMVVSDLPFNKRNVVKIGFTVDRRDGPFKLELKSIHAINTDRDQD